MGKKNKKDIGIHFDKPLKLIDLNEMDKYNDEDVLHIVFKRKENKIVQEVEILNKEVALSRKLILNECSIKDDRNRHKSKILYIGVDLLFATNIEIDGEDFNVVVLKGISNPVSKILLQSVEKEYIIDMDVEYLFGFPTKVSGVYADSSKEELIFTENQAEIQALVNSLLNQTVPFPLKLVLSWIQKLS